MPTTSAIVESRLWAIGAADTKRAQTNDFGALVAIRLCTPTATITAPFHSNRSWPSLRYKGGKSTRSSGKTSPSHVTDNFIDQPW
ncbi:hypothetical protein PILCRDRAFT_819147 [Piloderma croceum F 1598]|uniref:Uncharacterized protein n=1 Tax=Piloderma croceum (strain F 1598) TaxID=765440 RepID=A0A0C3FYZ3_PILCF|nr:hypothetical protein PILCRDRAFT_819147 [Piloderma croceum F 1598]